jgi:stage II sporulation protein D
MSRADRLSALYSGRLLFSDEREPILTVRVASGVRRLELRYEGGVVLLPEGPDGARLRIGGSGSFTVDITDAKPAESSWRVRLDRLPARDLGRVVRERKAWRERGVDVEPIEIGTVFGFHGTVLDNREVLLTTHAKKPGRKAAEALKERLQKHVDHKLRVDDWVDGPPRATVRLEGRDRDLHLEGPDLIWIETPKGARLLAKSIEYGGSGHNKKGKEDRVLSGLFYFTADRHGNLALGQAIGAEHLLRGIVPAEIYPSAAPAALQAQAITARGDLLAKLGKRHLDEPFMLCQNVHCQAYRGEGKEQDSTTRAVNETRGRVLFLGDDLVPAVYHASCGGHTERNEDAWPAATGHAALRGVHDAPPPARSSKAPYDDAAVAALLERGKEAYCAIPKLGRRSFRWEVELDSARLAKLLDPDSKLGPIRALEVIERGIGGHATKVEVRGARGSRIIGPELTIRRSLGGLRSTLMILHPSQAPDGSLSSLRIRGGGFGHAVGMCQNGAVGMATRGHETAEILRHYYGGAEIRRIY